MSLDVHLINNACPCCKRGDEVFWQNITHNLVDMAREAGIYDIVWRPEENGITSAGQLFVPLSTAIEDMKTRPKHYKKFNPVNGWGSYDGFVTWLEKYRDACEQYPNAHIEVSR